jgi:hypothetical protein
MQQQAIGGAPLQALRQTLYRSVLESIQKSSIFIAAQKQSFDFSFTESMPWNVGLIFRSSEIFIDNVVGGPQELRRRWRPFVCRSRLWITAVFC